MGFATVRLCGTRVLVPLHVQCVVAKMTLPNFLVVGAAKSGTTALYHYLRQHPQVYMSPTKETNFFAFEGQDVRFNGPGDEKVSETAITDLEVYKQQFASVNGEKAVGEASPWYLYSARSAKNIRRHIAVAKLIIVLRNPAERAFSSYLHVSRDGRETLSFEEGLLAEKKRIAQGWEYIWHYRRVGFYAAQVEQFLDLFPREQMHFCLYDDFLNDPNGFLQDIYEFLDVDSNFIADTSLRPNITGVPKNQLLGRLLLQPNPLKSTFKLLTPKQFRYGLGQKIYQRLLKKPSLNKETRGELLRSFEPDVLALQDLIRRDLSAWLEG